MNAPAELYALALVVLMERQGVHHFEMDLEELNRDKEKARGLSIDLVIEGTKVTIATGRCACPSCVAKTGATQ